MTKYILAPNGDPIEVDLMTWARWAESNTDDVIVAKTQLPGDVEISTVFRGIDHNFGRRGKPILWETMIFGGEHDGYQDRYTSRADAEKGHEAACRLARGEVSA